MCKGFIVLFENDKKEKTLIELEFLQAENTKIKEFCYINDCFEILLIKIKTDKSPQTLIGPINESINYFVENWMNSGIDQLQKNDQKLSRIENKKNFKFIVRINQISQTMITELNKKNNINKVTTLIFQTPILKIQ